MTEVVFCQLIVVDFHRKVQVVQDSGTLSLAMLAALTRVLRHSHRCYKKLENVIDKRVIPHDTMLQGHCTLQYLCTYGTSTIQMFRMASVQRNICKLHTFMLDHEDIETLKCYLLWTRENLCTDLVGCFVVSAGAQHWFFWLGILC